MDDLRYKIDENGCWIWQGRTSDRGYGVLHFNDRNFGAHRLSYMVHKGGIPNGMLVCHKCDVRKCINPEHLFLGTVKDNADDMVKKGRHRHGENATCVKLTDEQIREIRQSNVPGIELCKQYGVSDNTISSIRRRETWKHIP